MRADLIVAGDRLWSSATERELVVIAASRVLVSASGNLYHDGELADEKPDEGPKVPAIVLLVRNPDGSTQRLGAFAERARLQVVR